MPANHTEAEDGSPDGSSEDDSDDNSDDPSGPDRDESEEGDSGWEGEEVIDGEKEAEEQLPYPANLLLSWVETHTQKLTMQEFTKPEYVQMLLLRYKVRHHDIGPPTAFSAKLPEVYLPPSP